MALADYAPSQEPVAWGAAVTAVVAVAAYFFGWTPEVSGIVVAAVNAVLAIAVRQKVTPTANVPPAPPAVPPSPPA